MKVPHEGTRALGLLPSNGPRKQRVQRRLSWPQKQLPLLQTSVFGEREFLPLVSEFKAHESCVRTPSGPEPGESHHASRSADQTSSHSCPLYHPPHLTPLCLPRFPTVQFALESSQGPYAFPRLPCSYGICIKTVTEPGVSVRC